MRRVRPSPTAGMLATLVLSVGPVAADCDPKRPLDTPTANFELRGATAIDRTTGLEWRRCTLGLEWVDGACRGSVRDLTLADAIAAAAAEKTGWRVPSAQEMDSILESACRAPAINTEVFPDVTVSEGDSESAWVYWSATRYDLIPTMAYVFDYAQGYSDARSVGYALSVRLVRTANGRT